MHLLSPPFARRPPVHAIKKSVLPPRTQLGINADDEEMVLDIVGSFIDDILRGA